MTPDANQPSKTSDKLSDRLDDLRKRYQNDGADFPLGFEYDVLALIESEVQLAYGRGADDQREECVARDASKLRQARIDELLWVASLDSEGDWKSEIDTHLRQLREGDK